MIAPAVISHRGASAHAPENTLAAFRLAARMGASFIETDLRCTREGKFVFLHDARVNRTTNGRGRVAQLELGALRRLDAGSWFSREYAGERIPTLPEGLALAEELGLGAYLEMKVPLDASRLFALVRQLRQFHLDRLVLLSFQPPVLRALRAAEPRLKTALLVRRAGPAVETAKQAGAALLAPHRKRITATLVAQAHRGGFGVVTWTVNGRREMRKMLAMGVDGIMTNWPDRLTELLAENGLAAGLPAPGPNGLQRKTRDGENHLEREREDILGGTGSALALWRRKRRD
ncbi:MAG TPA: glycerophosphodiester phosphodiesterase family protein [Patescibacteria group bacterium]|nr:glycerophosphodiester phosphodiesterase family protein [Patescibacteria group bacterium]